MGIMRGLIFNKFLILNMHKLINYQFKSNILIIFLVHLFIYIYTHNLFDKKKKKNTHNLESEQKNTILLSDKFINYFQQIHKLLPLGFR